MTRGIFFFLCWLPFTAAAETGADEAALFDRLNTREQILDSQRSAAESTTRQRGLLAYRLARRRELGFAANPETRLDDARAFGLALVALRRSSDEANALEHELDHVRAEHSAMAAAFVTRASDPLNADEAEGSASPARLLRPVRGVPASFPGSRRDGPTKIELRHDGIEILVRLNEPVHAIAAGIVRHVEALPQGGFAITAAHQGGLTSIVTGLRDIAVKAGDTIVAGQTLGLAGRNLDGAAVVSVEIWGNRRPKDAAKLLRLRD
jgi:murein DD-endopeptidase MepM/ murein hydrolase activator NlpD